MSFKGIYLYATRSDHEQVFRALEAERPLKYTPSGLLKDPPNTPWNSIVELPGLGIAEQPIAPGGQGYLIADARTIFQCEEVVLTRGRDIGKSRYSVGQVENPDAIRFDPGGRYEEKWLLQGYIGTGSSDRETLLLYKWVIREIKKRSTRIRYTWLGPEALSLFASGFCLTDSALRTESPCLQRTPDNTYW